MPDTAKCCGECRWWVPDFEHSGTTIIGDCQFVVGPLPDCLDDTRFTTEPTDGENCPCFEPKEVKMKPKARPKETVMWFIVGPGGVIQWDICRDGKNEAIDSFAAQVDLNQKQIHDKGYRAVKCRVVLL